MTRMSSFASAFALASALIAGPALAAPEAYTIDPSHSQIVFSYNHLGFSTNWGMFSGFEGKINFDADAPAESSVEVEFPVTTMLTGWEERFNHFMTPELFNAEANPTVKFASTSIEVTGETTAKITGDLTLNGVTKPVVLDATLNKQGDHPMMQKPWLGVGATATIKRSDFNLGLYAPAISDDVEIKIQIEAQKAE